MPSIISIGECFIEFFTPKLFSKTNAYEKSFSGDTLNVLTMASKLGSSCGYISQVSDDELGDFLLDSWQKLKIDTSQVKQRRGFNAIEFYSTQPKGQSSVIVYRKGSIASKIDENDVEESYISKSNILHVSGISQGISETSRKAVLKAVKIAKSNSVTVSYDTNYRDYLWSNTKEAKHAMDEIIDYVDIIFPTHPEEPTKLLGTDDPDKIYNYFTSKNVNKLILKCGSKGVIAYNDNKKYVSKAIAPEGVMDPRGAGDTFVGAYLHCVNNNLDMTTSLQWATAAAGIKVGGRSIVAQPSLTKIKKHINNSLITESSFKNKNTS